MGPCILLGLPVEVTLLIAELLDPGSILRFSETCSDLNRLLLSPEHDAIWRPACVALGTPADVDLRDLVVSGTDEEEERRRWFMYCKLLKAWQKPFPKDSAPALPAIVQASQTLPTSTSRSVKHTITLACAGFGDNRGTISSVEDPISIKNDGKVIVSVRDLVNNTPAQEGELDIFTAIVGPAYRKSRDQRRSMTRKFSAYPHQSAAGLLFTKQADNWRVSKLDAATGEVIYEWDLGRCRPDRAATYQGMLVVMTWDMRVDQDADGLSPPPPSDPSHLICATAAKKWRSKKSQILWEYDINTQWAEEELRTSFPVLKIFHITKTHLVALVTRHDPSRSRKLTATRFTIVDLFSGETSRTITIPKVSASNPRSSFLTTFDHNFVVTDNFLVCGGVGGDLDVWQYNDPASVPDKPLYTLPSPFVFQGGAVSNPSRHLVEQAIDAAGRPVPRFYSNLCISVCGRYVAATTSNQLWTFDMVSKRISSCHHNGRQILPHDFYARNPPDDFPSGVWLRWVEWQKNAVTKQWERGTEETAYVTNIRSDDDSLEAYLKRRSRWRHMGPTMLDWLNDQDGSVWLWILAGLMLIFAMVVAVQPFQVRQASVLLEKTGRN